MLAQSKKLQPEQTPLERSNSELWHIREAMDQMVRLRNRLTGLSPETRNSWLEFKAGVWKDYRFKKDQRELYREATSADRKIVSACNEKEYKKVQRKKALRIFACGRCSDTGVQPRSGRYCKCEAGPRALQAFILSEPLRVHPNWKLSDDKKMAICLDCRLGFEKIKMHPCKSNE